MFIGKSPRPPPEKARNDRCVPGSAICRMTSCLLLRCERGSDRRWRQGPHADTSCLRRSSVSGLGASLSASSRCPSERTADWPQRADVELVGCAGRRRGSCSGGPIVQGALLCGAQSHPHVVGAVASLAPTSLKLLRTPKHALKVYFRASQRVRIWRRSAAAYGQREPAPSGRWSASPAYQRTQGSPPAEADGLPAFCGRASAADV